MIPLGAEAIVKFIEEIDALRNIDRILKWVGPEIVTYWNGKEERPAKWSWSLYQAVVPYVYAKTAKLRTCAGL